MTHPFVHSLPTKQNLKWSLKGVGIIHNDERVVEFTMMAFLQNAAKTNCDLGQFRWKSIWSRQTKVKDFFGGRRDGKECWNEILFETQSFPPRLTVKYILAPVRKRNDKCKKQRERESSGKDYIWNQNDETVYFIANYYSTKRDMNFFDIKSPSSKNIEEADEEVFVILFLCWWTRFGLWVLHSLLWSFVVILFLCWWKRCGCSTPKGRRALNVPLLVTLTDRPPGLPTWKIYSHKSQTYFSPFLTILI